MYNLYQKIATYLGMFIVVPGIALAAASFNGSSGECDGIIHDMTGTCLVRSENQILDQQMQDDFSLAVNILRYVGYNDDALIEMYGNTFLSDSCPSDLLGLRDYATDTVVICRNNYDIPVSYNVGFVIWMEEGLHNYYPTEVECKSKILEIVQEYFAQFGYQI